MARSGPHAHRLRDPDRWPRVRGLSVHRRDRPHPDLRGDEDPQCHARLVLCLRRVRSGERGRRLLRPGLAGGRRLPADGAGRHGHRARARPHHRARAAAPGLRPRRGDRRARHLLDLPHPRGRDLLDLGDQVLPALSAAGRRRQLRRRRADPVGLRHGADRARRRAGDRGALGAQAHPLRPPAHGGDLRPRDRGRLRHQCHRGVHRDLRAGRHAGRARRRRHGAEDLGDARHRRRGDRARLRGEGIPCCENP